MLVNKASIQAAFQGLKAIFHKAFEGAPVQWPMTAMKVPSSTSQETYAWLSDFPAMREWIGDKVVKDLEAFGYTIRNKRYEATVAVKRDDVEDDTLGIYGPQASEAGLSAGQLPDRLISTLKNGAFASLCYDGQYFYDSDHPVGDSTASNVGTAALSAATAAAALASLGAAITAIETFKNDEGDPLGLTPDTLEVPPALRATAKILCESDKLIDESPNPYNGVLKMVVNPRLTSSTAWFVHVTSRAVKPFVYQERKAPVFVQQTEMESDDVFMRGEWKFGAEARGNVGFGFWQMSYGSTGLA